MVPMCVTVRGRLELRERLNDVGGLRPAGAVDRFAFAATSTLLSKTLLPFTPVQQGASVAE